jgi:hypothetical protein
MAMRRKCTQIFLKSQMFFIRPCTCATTVTAGRGRNEFLQIPLASREIFIYLSLTTEFLLSSIWKPYRSIATWYLWASLDNKPM